MKLDAWARALDQNILAGPGTGRERGHALDLSELCSIEGTGFYERGDMFCALWYFSRKAAFQCHSLTLVLGSFVTRDI